MVGICKNHFAVLLACLCLFSAAFFYTDLANAKSYKKHQCEACQYQFRIDAEADYVKCPACGYESSLDEDDESQDSPRDAPNASVATDPKPLSTKKQLKKSLKEAKNEMIESTVNSLVNKMVGGEAGAGSANQSEGGAVKGPRHSRPKEAPSGNGARAGSVNNGMECSKCGYSAAFFPYADSSKKSLKCPSCGKTQKLR